MKSRIYKREESSVEGERETKIKSISLYKRLRSLNFGWKKKEGIGSPSQTSLPFFLVSKFNYKLRLFVSCTDNINELVHKVVPCK